MNEEAAQPKPEHLIMPIKCPLCLGEGAVAVKPMDARASMGWFKKASHGLRTYAVKFFAMAPVPIYRKPPQQKMGDALWKGRQKEDPPIMTEEGDVVVTPDGKPYRSKFK